MVRVLYWNIENFGLSKINDVRPPGKRGRGQDLTPDELRAFAQRVLQDSRDRMNFIVDTMKQRDGTMLDIFVLVETVAGGSTIGGLITGSGEQGANALLEAIRAGIDINGRRNEWMLVPPILLTSGFSKEGISVFFNSATLDFTGPYRWGGQRAEADGAFVGYGATDFPNTLPNVNVPEASAFNAGRNQNTLAGQCTFFNNGNPIGFPVRTKDRAPLLTTFWHRADNRNIKLLSYHAPKPQDAPSAGIIQLANIPEMTTGLGANEVGVIVGDFNVNVFDAELAAYAYGPLTTAPPEAGQRYTKHINAGTATTFPQKGYLCTTLYNTDLGTERPAPWGNMPVTNFGYPGYDYTTENSYDNILTRYGTGLVAPVDSGITIVNRVTGTPYNGLVPSTGGAPIGTFAYPSAMTDMDQTAALGTQALPLPPTHAGPDAQGGYDMNAVNKDALLTQFKLWQNYRKIRSTSDHLPLLIQV